MADYVVQIHEDILKNTSDIWVRKMISYFCMYDQEKKWVIRQEDLYNHVVKTASTVMDTERARKLVGPMQKDIWECIWEPAAIDVNGEQIVSVQSFVESRYEMAFQRTQEDKSNFIRILDTYFKVFDENSDGVISKAEYFKVLKMYGINDYATRVSFAAMDRDGDGNISFQEMTDTVLGFYFSKKYGPEILFWGCLVPNKVKYIKNDVPISVPKSVLDATSDIWVRKMLTFFRMYDRRRCWVVRESDFRDKLIPLAFASYTQERVEQIKANRKEFWNLVFKPAEKEVNGDRSVTVQDFLRHVQKLVSKTSGDPKCQSIVGLSFEIMDVNKDQQISREEFSAMQVLNGLNKYAIQVAFAAFDADVDGTISEPELFECTNLFFYSYKYDKGVLAYGPIYPVPVRPTDD